MATRRTKQTSEDERLRFVERFGSSLTVAGFPRLPARVFACLLSQDTGTLTSAEIGEALSVSPAAVSGAVRYLETTRMIHREREPGSRRDVYVVSDDAWHDALINSSATYAPITATLREGVGLVGGRRTPAGRRLSLSVEFLDFISEEMNGIAERWEKRRAELG